MPQIEELKLEDPPECPPPVFREPPTRSEEKDDEKEGEREETEEEKAAKQEALQRARSLKEDGNKYFAAYDYDNAVAMYTEAIETAPEGEKEKAVFYNNRATCYFKMGKHDEVIKDCTSALKIDPDYSKCLLRRAQVRYLLFVTFSSTSSQSYETEKKVCEAFDDYQKILKLDPSNQ